MLSSSSASPSEVHSTISVQMDLQAPFEKLFEHLLSDVAPQVVRNFLTQLPRVTASMSDANPDEMVVPDEVTILASLRENLSFIFELCHQPSSEYGLRYQAWRQDRVATFDEFTSIILFSSCLTIGDIWVQHNQAKPQDTWDKRKMACEQTMMRIRFSRMVCDLLPQSMHSNPSMIPLMVKFLSRAYQDMMFLNVNVLNALEKAAFPKEYAAYLNMALELKEYFTQTYPQFHRLIQDKNIGAEQLAELWPFWLHTVDEPLSYCRLYLALDERRGLINEMDCARTRLKTWEEVTSGVFFKHVRDLKQHYAKHRAGFLKELERIAEAASPENPDTQARQVLRQVWRSAYTMNQRIDKVIRLEDVAPITQGQYDENFKEILLNIFTTLQKKMLLGFQDAEDVSNCIRVVSLISKKLERKGQLLPSLIFEELYKFIEDALRVSQRMSSDAASSMPVARASSVQEDDTVERLSTSLRSLDLGERASAGVQPRLDFASLVAEQAESMSADMIAAAQREAKERLEAIEAQWEAEQASLCEAIEAETQAKEQALAKAAEQKSQLSHLQDKQRELKVTLKETKASLREHQAGSSEEITQLKARVEMLSSKKEALEAQLAEMRQRHQENCERLEAFAESLGKDNHALEEALSVLQAQHDALQRENLELAEKLSAMDAWIEERKHALSNLSSTEASAARFEQARNALQRQVQSQKTFIMRLQEDLQVRWQYQKALAVKLKEYEARDALFKQTFSALKAQHDHDQTTYAELKEKYQRTFAESLEMRSTLEAAHKSNFAQQMEMHALHKQIDLLKLRLKEAKQQRDEAQSRHPKTPSHPGAASSSHHPESPFEVADLIELRRQAQSFTTDIVCPVPETVHPLMLWLKENQAEAYLHAGYVRGCLFEHGTVNINLLVVGHEASLMPKLKAFVCVGPHRYLDQHTQVMITVKSKLDLAKFAQQQECYENSMFIDSHGCLIDPLGAYPRITQTREICAFADLEDRCMEDPLMAFRVFAIAFKSKRVITADEGYIIRQALPRILNAPLHVYLQIFSLMFKQPNPMEYSKDLISILSRAMPCHLAPITKETTQHIMRFYAHTLNAGKSLAYDNYELMALMLLPVMCYQIEKKAKSPHDAIELACDSAVRMLSHLGEGDKLLLKKRLAAVLPGWHVQFERFKVEQALERTAPAVVFSQPLGSPGSATGASHSNVADQSHGPTYGNVTLLRKGGYY